MTLNFEVDLVTVALDVAFQERRFALSYISPVPLSINLFLPKLLKMNLMRLNPPYNSAWRSQNNATADYNTVELSLCGGINPILPFY